MTAALLRWWTVPRLNVVIRTHPVLVRAELKKSSERRKKRGFEKTVARQLVLRQLTHFLTPTARPHGAPGGLPRCQGFESIGPVAVILVQFQARVYRGEPLGLK